MDFGGGSMLEEWLARLRAVEMPELPAFWTNFGAPFGGVSVADVRRGMAQIAAARTGGAGGAGGGDGGGMIGDVSGAVKDVLFSAMRGNMVMRAMVILGTTAILSAATWTLRSAYAYARRKAVVVVELDSRDESYQWLLGWLAEQPFCDAAEEFAVTALRKGLHDAPARRGFKLEPGAGVFYFWYGGRPVRVERVLADAAADAAGPGGAPRRERLRLEFLGRSGAAELASRMVEEAMHRYVERDKQLTVIYVGDQYGAWRRSTAAARRPLGSVILADGVLDALLADVRQFTETQAWYADRGIPYRRGYLLHGPPGCGKSSLIRALAGALSVDIYVINLSSKVLNDELLAELMRDVPYHSFLLFEDVDSIFQSEVGSESGANYDLVPTCAITFGGLLNAIDGVASQEGRLLFLTTNYPERLHPSLVRPGRIDRRVEIGLCTRPQAHRMFARFYPKAAPELAAAFAAALPDAALSMAQLQAFLMGHRDAPADAVAAMRAGLAVPPPAEGLSFSSSSSSSCSDGQQPHP